MSTGYTSFLCFGTALAHSWGKGKNFKGGFKMKRLTIVLGVLMVIAAIAYPVFARGPGWGPGNRMWGGPPGYCQGYGHGYGNLTDEQRSKLEALERKFYDETRDLRNELWAKAGELNTLLSGPDPDPDKAKALQREIGELRIKMAEKRLEYRLEARKIAPDAGFGKGYGRGFRKGYGPGMHGPGAGMGYGPGMPAPGAGRGFGQGWRGYGPGPGAYCWN
ncbi:MAG: hypothetical protein DRN37_11350 [Thermoplasmata archaeon]|nr:MAG: hypothetical protein DRN37_11350 [Thermoplasmata archaeon]